MTQLVLLKPHTHAGKTYLSGDRIDADDITAQWLLKYGIATLAPKPLKTDPESKPATYKDPKP